MKRLSIVITTMLIVSILSLFILRYTKNTTPTASPVLVDENDLVQRYYKIDEIRAEIEMLEVDKIFHIRPDDVIQKELDIANARLDRLTKLFK